MIFVLRWEFSTNMEPSFGAFTSSKTFSLHFKLGQHFFLDSKFHCFELSLLTELQAMVVSFIFYPNEVVLCYFCFEGQEFMKFFSTFF